MARAPSSGRNNTGGTARYRLHGIAADVHGELILDLPRAPNGDAGLTVFAGQRPAWANASLDPDRLLVSGETNPGTAILEGGWTADGSGVRIRFKEGADFWIDAGATQIWTEWRAPLTMLDAAYFLCDPVMAFVLRRRGTLALHASAIDLDGCGVAFVGAAGAGKSVSAGACVAAGARLVTDDVAAVSDVDGVLHISPGPPWLRAWDEGAHTLLGDAERAPRFSETWEKRIVLPALLGGAGAETDVPLRMICVMADRYATGRTPVWEPLVGRAALEALVPVTAANYLHDPETRARELGQLGELLARVPAVRLFVPEGAEGLRELPGVLRRAIGD